VMLLVVVLLRLAPECDTIRREMFSVRSKAKTPFTRYNQLSNRLNNRSNACLYDAAGCSTGCSTGLATGCIV